MKIMDSYPLVTVGNMAASRDFFVRHFDMQVIFQADWVSMLSAIGAKVTLRGPSGSR